LYHIKKSIYHYFREEPLFIDLTTDAEEQVIELKIWGYSWENVMVSISLLSKNHILHKSDVINILSFYPSIEDILEIY
jgi:hypothetical protein